MQRKMCVNCFLWFKRYIEISAFEIMKVNCISGSPSIDFSRMCFVIGTTQKSFVDRCLCSLYFLVYLKWYFVSSQ